MLKFLKPDVTEYFAILHPSRMVKFQTLDGALSESSYIRILRCSHFLAGKTGDGSYKILKDRSGFAELGSHAALNFFEAYAEDLGLISGVELDEGQ